MHLDTLLGLIGECETIAATTAVRLREQISLLTTKLTRIDRELADLATTRTMLRELTATKFTADDPTIVSAACQQILTALGTASTGMRAKDICLALGIDPLPKHVEGARAKLKRLQPRTCYRRQARNLSGDPETDLIFLEAANTISGRSG